MLKSEELLEPILEVQMNERDDDANSSCSEAHFSHLPTQRKITVEYESVGSFQVFETICPLEFYGKANGFENDDIYQRKSKHKALKGRKSKIQTITIANDLTTESAEDLTSSRHARQNNRQRSAPTSLPITLDAFFRSENPESPEPIEGSATVVWAKGDFLNNCKDDETDSDLDLDTATYIKSQKEKRRLGENVTGENLWYDQERSIIRNLHTDGSISLTAYGDTDEKIFGKTEIFEAIMTCEERAMLRARNLDTTYKKIDKKISEGSKKGKKIIRPKDQGDWL